MKRIVLFLAIALTADCLTGCTAPNVSSANNLFARYFTGRPVPDYIPLAPPSVNPEIETVQVESWPYHWDRLGEQGFILIGMSAYRGNPPDERRLVAYAKSIGADLAVLSSQISYVEQGAIPWFAYHPGQAQSTYHSGTATANIYSGGSNAYGTGTYSGISTTRTPSTFTPMVIPYQRTIYEVGASFWRRRLKPVKFGVAFDNLPDEVSARLQRNTGAWVRFVVRDGGAFRANILHGDVIIQFGAHIISSPQDLVDVVGLQDTGKVVVKVIRGSETKDIEVDLGPAGQSIGNP